MDLKSLQGRFTHYCDMAVSDLLFSVGSYGESSNDKLSLWSVDKNGVFLAEFIFEGFDADFFITPSGYMIVVGNNACPWFELFLKHGAE